MRPINIIAVVAVMAGAAPASAQTTEFEWPTYTDAQLWNRVANQATLVVVAAMRYAKEHGQGLDQFNQWWADTFLPSWGRPGAYGPRQVVRGMRLNMLSFGATVEVVEDSDASVTARISRPWVPYFGESGEWYGITMSEYEALLSHFMKQLGERHDLDMVESRDGDHMVIRYARR